MLDAATSGSTLCTTSGRRLTSDVASSSARSTQYVLAASSAACDEGICGNGTYRSGVGAPSRLNCLTSATTPTTSIGADGCDSTICTARPIADAPGQCRLANVWLT